MALVKCKECGAGIAKTAKTCPQCGAPNRKKVGVIGWIFALVFVLPVAWGVGKAINASAPPPSVVHESEKGWKYSQVIDKVSGQPMKLAGLTSPDLAFFDFPYNQSGGSRLTMTLRNHPRHGVDVMFSISKGHMLCHRSDCVFPLSVEGIGVTTLAGARPDDNSVDTFFVAKPDRFVRDVLKAGKPFVVEVRFHQEGSRAFRFDPRDLTWQ